MENPSLPRLDVAPLYFFSNASAPAFAETAPGCVLSLSTSVIPDFWHGLPLRQHAIAPRPLKLLQLCLRVTLLLGVDLGRGGVAEPQRLADERRLVAKCPGARAAPETPANRRHQPAIAHDLVRELRLGTAPKLGHPLIV